MIENVVIDLSFLWTSSQNESKPTHEAGHKAISSGMEISIAIPKYTT